MRKYEFPVIIEKDEESGLFVAFVPDLPGCHTQAATLDELERNVREVVELCLEEALAQGEINFPIFYGLHRVTVEA